MNPEDLGRSIMDGSTGEASVGQTVPVTPALPLPVLFGMNVSAEL